MCVCALQTKKRFAKEWAEAEKATQQAEKTESDLYSTKLDVEKVNTHTFTINNWALFCCCCFFKISSVRSLILSWSISACGPFPSSCLPSLPPCICPWTPPTLHFVFAFHFSHPFLSPSAFLPSLLPSFVTVKARQHAHARTHTAEECRNDYAALLQKYNKEQNFFYYSEIPQIFNVRHKHTRTHTSSQTANMTKLILVFILLYIVFV